MNGTMIFARPHILIKVIFLKHFALVVWVSIGYCHRYLRHPFKISNVSWPFFFNYTSHYYDNEKYYINCMSDCIGHMGAMST